MPEIGDGTVPLVVAVGGDAGVQRVAEGQRPALAGPELPLVSPQRPGVEPALVMGGEHGPAGQLPGVRAHPDALTDHQRGLGGGISHGEQSVGDEPGRQRLDRDEAEVAVQDLRAGEVEAETRHVVEETPQQIGWAGPDVGMVDAHPDPQPRPSQRHRPGVPRGGVSRIHDDDAFAVGRVRRVDVHLGTHAEAAEPWMQPGFPAHRRPVPAGVDDDRSAHRQGLVAGPAHRAALDPSAGAAEQGLCMVSGPYLGAGILGSAGEELVDPGHVEHAQRGIGEAEGGLMLPGEEAHGRQRVVELPGHPEGAHRAQRRPAAGVHGPADGSLPLDHDRAATATRYGGCGNEAGRATADDDDITVL